MDFFDRAVRKIIPIETFGIHFYYLPQFLKIKRLPTFENVVLKILDKVT